MVEKKNKPRFNVSNVGMRRSRLKNRGYRWRRPRADSNKKKMKRAFAGASPTIGYRNPPEMRGIHPCGLPEVLVHTEHELVGVSDHVIRIASAVGGKKAAKIEEAAKAAKLRVLNPRRKKKTPDKEDSKSEKKDSKTEVKEVPKQLKSEEQISKIDNKDVVKESKPVKVVSKIDSKEAVEQLKPEKPVSKTNSKDAIGQEPKKGDKV